MNREEDDGMKPLTGEVLQQIVPGLDPEKAEVVVESLGPAMAWAEINTFERVTAFLAQIAHETGGFKWFRELGNDSYFDKYEGREDLGNTEPGDGARYKGRGYIQCTGRYNYTRAGYDLNLDLVNQPEMAESPEVGAYIAAWYWNKHDLNRYADAGDTGAMRAITKRINGGYNGLSDRLAYWERAKEALSEA